MKKTKKWIMPIAMILCIIFVAMRSPVSVSAAESKATLSTPTGLKYTATTQNSITVTWNKSELESVQKYEVYLGSRLIGRTNGQTTYVIKNLSPNTYYYISVRAKGADNSYSAKCNEIFAYTRGEGYVYKRDNSPMNTKTNTKVVIESIKEGQTVSGMLKVSGYYLTFDSDDSSIFDSKVTVDGKEASGFIIENEVANDIGKSNPQYNGAKKVKFETYSGIDSYICGNGKHKLAVSIMGGVAEVTINVQNKEQILVVESPTNNSSQEGGLEISGYFLSSVTYIGYSDIKVYFDGSTTSTSPRSLTYGMQRNDLKSKYPAYANAGESGFKCKFDISDMKSGKHTVLIEIRGQKKQIDINIITRQTIISIDNNFNNTLSGFVDISGYILSSTDPDDVKKYTKVYVDGKRYDDNDSIFGNRKALTANIARSDVKNSYPQYKYASNSGIKFAIDTYDFTNGSHKLKIEFKGVTKEYTFKVNSLAKKLVVEYPGSNSSINGIIDIKGYFLSSYNPSMYVQDDWFITPDCRLYLDDGTKYTALNVNVTRNDVKNSYPSYPYADRSGFNLRLDTVGLSNGTHKLKIVCADVTKEVTVVINNPTSDIVIESYQSKYIDPASTMLGNSGWNLLIKGYILSPYRASDYNNGFMGDVNVYLDGEIDNGLFNSVKMGIKRSDLVSKYPNYKYVGESGFEYLLEINSLTKGQHKIKFQFKNISKEFTINI